MRVLVAPQEFKGTLTAREAAEAIARGVLRAHPRWRVEVAPLADGGPGTVDAFLSARGGQRRTVRCDDPLGRPIDADFALLDDDAAVVEMAAASGLWRLSRDERDPLQACTHGTGELIGAALDSGATSVLVGAGGSATNDGGAGALRALGVRFLDSMGADLPRGGAALAHLHAIEVSGLDPRLARSTAQLTLATDVRNPLLGPEGATCVYGPQKGASSDQVKSLEAALAHFADVVERTLGVRKRDEAGAGAAGGLAFGLSAVAGARIVPGFEEIARALKLEERIERADWVLTGEGRVDDQTHFGKGPFALARLARKSGRPVLCFAGVRAPGIDAGALGFAGIIETSPTERPPPELAARRLEQAACEWATLR